ncbi:MAG: GGDEF domain-containing protein [Defluviitaleaceae bacterium]|nr:GGDEF domain-containing protein [Defluviitaleaceae bacterium]
MERNSEKRDNISGKLRTYLHDVTRDPSNAVINTDELGEFSDFARELQQFCAGVIEMRKLAETLADGNIDAPVSSGDNELTRPLESLQHQLQHITQQTKLVSGGDYTRRLRSKGEFSDAFNIIVNKLAINEQRLKDEIRRMEEKNLSIEHYGLLITTLIQFIPQQILVLAKENCNVLLMNELALTEIHMDFEYAEKIHRLMSEHTIDDDGSEIDIRFPGEEAERHFLVRAFELEWSGIPAVIYSISDVSEVRGQIRELEVYAYHDSLTHLYNRTYGMKTLEEWLRDRKHFSLLFADLDGLKHINDTFGHNEGDMYIKNAGRHLRSFPRDAIVCRLGGDEFMVLIPNRTEAEVLEKFSVIYNALHNDEYLADKDYTYSMSVGVVEVAADNELPSKAILSTADEKMYENKKARKKERLN